MAINITCTFRKTCGLPGFSSVAAGAEVSFEVGNLEDIPRVIEQNYKLLQGTIDGQLSQAPGFVPPSTYGMDEPSVQPQAPTSQSQLNEPQLTPRNVTPSVSNWKCSAKQKELILKLIDEKAVDKSSVEQLAKDMFSKGVIKLNKLEASGLIERLFELPSPAGKKSYQKGGQR